MGKEGAWGEGRGEMGTALHYTLPPLLPYRLTGRKKTPTYLLTTGVPGKGERRGMGRAERGEGGNTTLYSPSHVINAISLGVPGRGGGGGGGQGVGVQHYITLSLPCY